MNKSSLQKISKAIASTCKSSLFSKAHTIAKEIREHCNSYCAAFSLSLIGLYAEIKNAALKPKAKKLKKDLPAIAKSLKAKVGYAFIRKEDIVKETEKAYGVKGSRLGVGYETLSQGKGTGFSSSFTTMSDIIVWIPKSRSKKMEITIKDAAWTWEGIGVEIWLIKAKLREDQCVTAFTLHDSKFLVVDAE